MRARWARLAGAVFIIVGGAVHAQLLRDGYGTDSLARSFTANAVVAALIAAYLVLRRDRIGPIVGIVFSVASLVALAVAHTGIGLMGFMERGIQPKPQLPLAVAAEVLAVLALAVAATARPTSAPAHAAPGASAEASDASVRRTRPLVAPSRLRSSTE